MLPPLCGEAPALAVMWCTTRDRAGWRPRRKPPGGFLPMGPNRSNAEEGPTQRRSPAGTTKETAPSYSARVAFA